MGLTPKPTSPAGKWLGFVTAVWMQSIGGIIYGFSNYSDALKALMNLTQLQLNNLSVAKDVGLAFGLLPGLASDRIPSPLLLLIGALEALIGYGVLWLVTAKIINPLPYWLMCVILGMAGNSGTWMNTAVLVPCMRNFRKNRGPVSGILKGYMALSTAILTDLCAALSSDNPSTFLLMSAVVPIPVCLAAALFLREIPPSSTPAEESEETRYFGITNALAVILAVYLLVYDVTGTRSSAVSFLVAVVLLILLASPLWIPIYLAIKSLVPSRSKSDSDNVEGYNLVNEPLLLGEESVEEAEKKREMAAGATVAVEQTRRPVIGEDHTIFEAFRTAEFWILFGSFLCGVGTGLTVMNNMGQIGQAVGYGDVSIFVSLISIFGFFGRIISGTVSEYFIKIAGTPRPLWTAASQIVMAVGYVIMAMALPGSLHVGSIFVGVCYGVRYAIMVSTASELFGLKYYGLIYNILILNLPLGSFLFSGLLAGYFYDAQATSTAGGGNSCTGAHCYRLVFVIMSIACIIGFSLDVLLVIRTKNVYAKIYASMA
ncbi:hypothetical protein RHSIM_Rhsim09G0052800 [Rhododendron simsii]|uniref:Nodulin-like domain-containing protein n=1 Tax=Rhododendron simsii TaxID=118357 RepID=A0A834LEE5_RHOSS|nr:hypothetical protein RHSIM_Rhsim09G0052800 [Rhododendron simsii]